MKTIHKIVVSIVGVLLLAVTIVLVIMSFGALRHIKESANARKHAFMVIQSSDELMASLIDAETGQRGYLLTQDKAYLKPYLEVAKSIKANMVQLRQFSIISGAAKYLDTASLLVDAKLAYLSHSIELVRNNETATAIVKMGGSDGMVLMEKIREQMSLFKHVEEKLLEKHDAEFHADMRNFFIVIAVVSVFMLLFSVLTVYLIYRDTQNQLANLVNIQTKNLLDVQKDINTRLQLANSALQISEEKFEVTLNSIGDGVMSTDTKGCVTFLNPVAEKLTGWTKIEAYGLPEREVFCIIDEGTRSPSISPVNETLLNGTTQALANHTVLIARGGKECAIADSCAPIRNREGNVVGAVLVFRDVTERSIIENNLKKAHEELKELSKELKRIGRAKSEFLANMSHELRTPLNSINGFSEVIYDEIFGPLNAKQKQYVNNVLTSGQHLLLLINQILDMSKVESGKMKMSLVNMQMKKVINEISMLVTDMADKKKLLMSLDISEDLPDIQADELKVKEILYNLLSNAVKYTQEGGKIGIRAKKTASDIEVEVWDTGDGIASENMEKIFEGFFRVDTPYSKVTEGTGLGLPLSKKLAELHNGRLTVESAGLNKGTTVKFTLPIISGGVA